MALEKDRPELNSEKDFRSHRRRGEQIRQIVSIMLVISFLSSGQVMAAVFPHSPTVALSLQKNSLNTAKDMFGKPVMSYGGTDVDLFAMLLQEGIPAKDVDWQPMSYSINSQISGDTDFYLGHLIPIG